MKFIGAATLAAVVAGQDETTEETEWVQTPCPGNLNVMFFSDADCANNIEEVTEFEQLMEDWLNGLVEKHEDNCAAVEGTDPVVYGEAFCDESYLYALGFDDSDCTEWNDKNSLFIPLTTCFPIDEGFYGYVWSS